jgi:hypothetical protein
MRYLANAEQTHQGQGESAMKNVAESFPIIKSCVTFFVLGIFASGCTNNPASTTMASTNTPVIANTTNAFTFVVAANNYTQNENWGLAFTSDSIAFSVVSGNYISGSVLFTVTDSTNATVFQETINANRVIALTQSGTGVPARCTINCSHYTGSLTFAMSGYN